MVVEAVKESLGKKITKSVAIPTIGIGAGKYCDGQILVTDDMLGLFDTFTPKFVKKYANLHKDIDKASRKIQRRSFKRKISIRKNSYN